MNQNVMSDEQKKAQSDAAKFANQNDIRIHPVRNGFIMKTGRGEFVYAKLSDLITAVSNELTDQKNGK